MERRERLREQTRTEIKDHARRLMAEGGNASLSLGAIARAMGMTTPALYRYYSGRDDLLTELIIDAYNALADAQAAAKANFPAEDLAEQLHAASLAYRIWAIENPSDFLLLFGTPVPDYHAPKAQVFEAASRVFRAFLDPMQAAADRGILRVRHDLVTAAPDLCLPLGHDLPPLADPPVLLTGIAAWGRIHGLIMLEVCGHVQGIRDPAQFYLQECLDLLHVLGMSLRE